MSGLNEIRQGESLHNRQYFLIHTVLSYPAIISVYGFDHLLIMLNSNLILLLSPSGPATLTGRQKSLLSGWFFLGCLKETLVSSFPCLIRCSPGPAPLTLVCGAIPASSFLVPYTLVSSPTPQVLVCTLLLPSPEMAASPRGPCLSAASPCLCPLSAGPVLIPGRQLSKPHRLVSSKH